MDDQSLPTPPSQNGSGPSATPKPPSPPAWNSSRILERKDIKLNSKDDTPTKRRPVKKKWDPKHAAKLFADGKKRNEHSDEMAAVQHEEYTFKPVVNKKFSSSDGKRLGSKTATGVFERLASKGRVAAEKAKKTIAKLKLEKAEKEESQIYRKPQKKKTDGGEIGTAPKKKIHDPERMNRLYKDASEIISRREKKKEEENRKNTFKPKPRKKNRHSTGVLNESRVESLYTQGVKKQMERYKDQELNPRSEGCTFKPQLTSSGASSTTTGNVASRLHLSKEDHQLRLEKKKQLKSERQSEACSFQPKVNHLKGGAERPNVNIHDRLYREALTKLEKKKAEEAQVAESTAPEITATKIQRRRFSESIDFSNRGNVFDRLYEVKVPVEDELISVDVSESAECTFKPSLPHSNKKMVATPTNGEKIHDRLYKSGLEHLRRRSIDVATIHEPFSTTSRTVSSQSTELSETHERLYSQGLQHKKARDSLMEEGHSQSLQRKKNRDSIMEEAESVVEEAESVAE